MSLIFSVKVPFENFTFVEDDFTEWEFFSAFDHFPDNQKTQKMFDALVCLDNQSHISQ